MTEPHEEELPQGFSEGFSASVERPLECTECRKAIAVRYTEVVASGVTTVCMCAECPQLQKRLFGLPPNAEGLQGEMGLVCGDCGTTLANIRMGSMLGCSHCYEIFGDAVIHELRVAHALPAALAGQKMANIHVGRSPGELSEISPTTRLAALNQALIETLHREDYEQAALLRDQIRTLTEHSSETETHADSAKNGISQTGEPP
jgi:protein arginine kinase activator